MNNEEFEHCPRLTVYAHEGSFAAQYAKKNDIPYRIA